MDVVSALRPYSVFFLILSIVFAGVAVGVVPAPASGVVSGSYSGAQVSGGSIESAVWSYNPTTKMWHFQIVAGASAYQMVIGLPKQRVSGAEGAYEVEPYALTVDLSRVYYALPMEQDPSRVVYGYKFVDCGRVTVPYNVWEDFASQVAGFFTGGIARSVYDFFQSGAVKQVYENAYQSCRSKVDQVVSSMNAKYAVGYVLFSADSRTVSLSIPVLGKVYSATLYDPHFYGVVKYEIDTWSPKVSSEMYPVGSVKVTVSGKNGSSSVNLLLSGSSVTSLPDGSKGVFASARLPVVNGYIRYVGYFRSVGDVYHLSDPWVLNYNGKYVPVSSSMLSDYVGRASQLDDLLATTSYLVNDSVSFDGFISAVGSYGLDRFASESVSVRGEVSSAVSQLDSMLDYDVEQSPWTKYVVSFDVNGGVVSYPLLQLRPISSYSPAFKLVLSGDVNAEWLGLRPLFARGEIVSFPHDLVTVTRSGGASFQFTVKNVSDVSGAFDWMVNCGSYGVLASGTTSVVRPGSTVVVPVTGYLEGIGGLSKEQQVQCKITVSDLFGDVTDSAVVYLNYKPEVVCPYSEPTCATRDGVQGYYYCTSPYEPAVFKKCAQGEVCQMGSNGAECVSASSSSSTEANSLAFCSGSKICYVVNGHKQCESCPNGGTCTYILGEGAKCTGKVSTPAAPSKNVLYVEPAPGRSDLWRVGAALAAFGSLIVWVVLV